MKHWEVWEIKLLCVETDKMSCTMGSVSPLLSLEWWWWWGWWWLRLDFLRKDEWQEHLDRKDLTALVVSMEQGYMFCFQFEAFTSCTLTSLTQLDFGVSGERPGWIQSWKHWFRQIAQTGTSGQNFKVTDNLCYPRMVSKNMVKTGESSVRKQDMPKKECAYSVSTRSCNHPVHTSCWAWPSLGGGLRGSW